MNKYKTILVLIICLCIVLSWAVLTSVYASGPTVRIARIITLANISGSNITLSNGGPRTFTPREGQRLSSGSIVSTGVETSARLNLDEASSLQMDEKSQVQVSSSGSRLVLSLQSGNALVHVPNQVEGRDIECRVGATGLVVRGTMFVIGQWGDIVTITMLSGYGEVHSGGEVVPLPAGTMAWVFDDNHEPEDIQDLTSVAHYDLEQGHALVTQMMPHFMDMFALQAVYDNQEYLHDAGAVSGEMLAEVTRLLFGTGSETHTPWIFSSTSPPASVPTPAPMPTPIPTIPPVVSPGGLIP